MGLSRECCLLGLVLASKLHTGDEQGMFVYSNKMFLQLQRSGSILFVKGICSKRTNWKKLKSLKNNYNNNTYDIPVILILWVHMHIFNCTNSICFPLWQEEELTRLRKFCSYPRHLTFSPEFRESRSDMSIQAFLTGPEELYIKCFAFYCPLAGESIPPLPLSQYLSEDGLEPPYSARKGQSLHLEQYIKNRPSYQKIDLP